MTSDELSDYLKDREEFHRGGGGSREEWLAFLLWRIGEGTWASDATPPDDGEEWKAEPDEDE